MRDVFSAIGGFASPFGSRRGTLIPIVYLSFIPSGSTGLITADSLVFRVVGVASPEEWAIEGSMILQSPTPPDAANYRIVGTTVEAV